jgi:cysteine sulfinate desulfinase/cysteine desulfurase-like protein
MGVSYEMAHASIRISLGRFTSRDDVEQTILILEQVCKELINE